MKAVRDYIFKKNRKTYNLFIGGVASVINTPELLASKLSVTVDEIKYFTIVGSDIACVITEPYSVNTYGFRDNLLITYFTDTENCVSVGYNSFYNSGIQTISCINLVDVGIESFRFSELNTVSLPKLENIERSAFRQTKLVDVYFPELLSLADSAFYRTTTLLSFDAPKLINIDSGSTFDRCVLNYCNIPLCTAIGGSSLNNNIFRDTGTTGVYNINVLNQTNNEGSPDPDVQYVIDRGCTVNWII